MAKYSLVRNTCNRLQITDYSLIAAWQPQGAHSLALQVGGRQLQFDWLPAHGIEWNARDSSWHAELMKTLQCMLGSCWSARPFSSCCDQNDADLTYTYNQRMPQAALVLDLAFHICLVVLDLHQRQLLIEHRDTCGCVQRHADQSSCAVSWTTDLHMPGNMSSKIPTNEPPLQH